jgi:hypothetical protein
MQRRLIIFRTAEIGVYSGASAFVASSGSVQQVVNKKAASVTPNAATKVYGSTDPVLIGSTSGFLATDGVTASFSRAAGEAVAGGPYTISATLSPAGVLGNYAITYQTANFTITARPITVTADAQTKVYGATDPALTYQITAGNLVSGDGFSGSLTRTVGEDVGSYTINQSTLALSSNYDLTFVGANLTIGQRPITVTADAQTKVYGATDPALTYQITTGTLASGDRFSGGLTRATGEDVGAYPIGQGTLSAGMNYALRYIGNTLTITPATPAIDWPNPADITYGTALGGAQLDAATNVAGTLTYTPAAGTVLKAGASQMLSVSFTPTDSTDYATVTATTTIGVTRATPALTVSAPGGTYDGTPFPATVAIASGIPGLNDIPAASLENVTPIVTYYDGAGTSGTSLGSAPPTSAGTYAVVARFPGSTDYAPMQSAPVVFTIDRGVAAMAVAVSPSSAVYGQSITFVATVVGASVPSGTVTFFDGATSLATVPLDGSGKVALTTTGLAIGSHAITATYSGDADFFGSQWGSTTESVSQASTEIVLVPHPVLRKRKVVSLGLTAEVVPVEPGGGVPTGMVTFEFLVKHGKKPKVKTLGRAALHGAEATLTVKPKAVLNKPITIIYGGDPNFRASTLTPPKLTQAGLKSLALRAATGQ